MVCDYCQQEAKQVTGRTIYPHRPDLYHKVFWYCAPCDAWVGCHEKTMKPLGRLANAELRRAKMRAHAAFDSLWKSGEMNRHQAYRWLANQMGLTIDTCHIGMFGLDQCAKVLEVCQQTLGD